MDKKKIGIIVFAVIFILIILVVLSSTNDSNSNNNNEEVSNTENTTDITENKTDINALKSSEYTSASFDEVNIGDSKSDVEEKMGPLTEVGKGQDGSDIYTVSDEQSNYYFFFEGDKLTEVSVILK